GLHVERRVRMLRVGVEAGPDRKAGMLLGRPMGHHQPAAEEGESQAGHQRGERSPPGGEGGRHGSGASHRSSGMIPDLTPPKPPPPSAPERCAGTPRYAAPR